MNPKELQRLGNLLRHRREKLGWRAREVARRAGVDVSTVTRIEQAQIPSPKPDSLAAIAQALDIPAADLFAIAHWLPKKQLPTFQPYMRAKYADLPDEAVAELEAFLADWSEKYGVDGPVDGEDERDP